MKKQKYKLSIMDPILLIANILYLIGIRYWFPTCAVSGDTIMACHWAGQMLKAVSILLTVLAVVHFLPDQKIKAGIDISLIGIYVMTMLIPGRIINLCVKEGMACRAKTLSMTMVFCVLMLVLTLVDAFLCLSKEADSRHRRRPAEQE